MDNVNFSLKTEILQTMFSHHKRTLEIFSNKEKLGNIKLVNASFSWLFLSKENIRLQKDLEPLGEKQKN
jgi:hypothetical protein